MYFDNCKRLVVFGDSLTYGHGLPDADNLKFEKPSSLSWANTVAMNYGLELYNKAIPGSGNDSMFRAFNEYLIGIFANDHHNATRRFSAVYKPGDAVIIGLSNLWRTEVYDFRHQRYERILVNSEYFYDPDLEKSVRYIMAAESEDSLISKMLQQIHNIVSMCRHYNIPVLLFHALPPIDHKTNSDIINQTYIPPSCQSMLKRTNCREWLTEVMHNEISLKLGRDHFLPCGHPSASGQDFWGKRLINYIEDL
jgi:hypothetical protein